MSASAFSRIRRALRLSSVAVALSTAAAMLLTVTSVPAFAVDDIVNSKKKPPHLGQSVCGGTSMLPELREADPEGFAAMIAEGEAVSNTEAVLWKVQRGDGPVSHLFGTIHLSDPRVAVMGKPVRDAISQSKVVALEVADASPTATSSAIAEARNLVLFTNGDRLDRLLSAESFEKVKETLAHADLPARLAHLFKPWVVSMIMTVPACERKQVKKGEPVLDSAIARLARAKKIPVVGLETIQSQLEAAASVPMGDQLKLLSAGLAYQDRANDLMETLLQIYLDRNVGMSIPLQRLLAKRAGVKGDGYEGYQRELIENRNRRMRTKSLPLLINGNAFIAVGALHLIGPSGLVALYREAGYTVTPVE